MQNKQLYAQILGLTSPWNVSDVKLDLDEGKVVIHVVHDKGIKWCCPECGMELVCRDHAATRFWRHLNTCHLKTYIQARIPRVNCPVHGVRQVNIPWAEYRSRFSVLMERMIIDVITECASLRGVCRIMDISWDEAWKVMEKAVQRGLERKGKLPSTHIGIDEKAIRKGHDYVTIVYDLKKNALNMLLKIGKNQA